jgi:hypothetical protein
LHNVFLENDCLNKDWEQGGGSEWEGELGEFDDDDLDDVDDYDDDEYDDSGIGPGNHSCMGPGNDIRQENTDALEIGDLDSGIQDIQNCHEVRHCSYNVFKQKLFEHFDILFQKGLVKWPTRNGSVEFTLSNQ